MKCDTVLDIHHAGDGASGLEKQLWRGVRVGDELHELDAHEGDLGEEVFEVGGFQEGLLLFLGESRGVETMPAAILVAEGSASLTAGRYGPGRRGMVVVRGLL